jgi:cytosine deaminase
MSADQIHSLGHERLARVARGAGDVEAWWSFLLGCRFRSPDDAPVWLTCTLALEAVAQGNYGVGALLLDASGHVAALGHNEVFLPHFRSDRHAEMVVLDAWEDAQAPAPAGGDLTLYTSLEPCPMCLVRLSTSAVPRIVFAAPDPSSGMVQRMSDLPPLWRELAQRKVFAPARCSEDLTRAAAQIFLLNLEALNARVGGTTPRH